MPQTVGDVRPRLVSDHKKLIEKAMNKHNPLKDKTYYILVTADWSGDDLKSFAFVLDVKPPIDLISTMLYEVDPVTGKYEVVYCKPRDIPTSHIILDNKRSNIQDLIAQNNMDTFTPIIHN